MLMLCFSILGLLSFDLLMFVFQYSGGRSEEDFVNFMNEKCGTKRTPGGGLNDEVNSVEIE